MKRIKTAYLPIYKGWNEIHLATIRSDTWDINIIKILQVLFPDDAEYHVYIKTQRARGLGKRHHVRLKDLPCIPFEKMQKYCIK